MYKGDGMRLSLIFHGLGLCVGLTLAAQTYAQPIDGRTLVSVQADIAEARLELAEIKLAAMGSSLASRGEVSGGEGHNILAAAMDGVDIGRSVLAINRQGVLQFDSYNRLRFVKPDLSDREYVINGLAAPTGQVALHAPVFGRQSGLPFLPLTYSSPVDPSGRLLMMTFLPDRLIPDIPVCTTCGFLVLMKGEVIASSHALSTANEDLAARLKFDGEYGQTNLTVRGMELAVSWQKSDKHGVVFLYYSGGAGFLDE